MPDANLDPSAAKSNKARMSNSIMKRGTQTPKSGTGSGGNSRNSGLNAASSGKKDEFYTQYEDVSKEVDLYPGVFKGKNIFCNCDDPFESSFFRYFVLNFDRLGLASLTSTSYVGSPVVGQKPSNVEPAKPYVAVVTKVPAGAVTRSDGTINWDELFSTKLNSISLLRGDGDFRSDECVSILINADVVVTNPPFSLFREFIGQLVKYDKKFLVLGNMNAATYREVFPLFRENKIWYGESIRSGDRKFFVPSDYPLNASGCGVDKDGRRFIRVKGVRWFTNLENARRFEGVQASTAFSESEYQYFENYNAINVARVKDIPADFQGVMGVPITFLDHYNPDQFEILMLANGNARTNVPEITLRSVGYRPHPLDKGGVGIIHGRRSYARILIRRTKP